MTVPPATRPVALVRRHPIESAVVLLALVAALWLSIRVGTLGWHPMGDYRTLQLRVSDVGGSETPLVGLYSRFGWNHPGPWVYWLLAGPARLFGDDGLLVGAVMVNLAAVAAAVSVCVGAGRRWVVVCALTIALLCAGIGLGGLADPWNPFLVVLPLFTMLVATWRALDGSRAGAIVAVVAGSFAVGAHFGSAPLVAAMLSVLAFALVWRSVRGPERRAARTTLVWSAGAALVLWAPALLEQAIETPGNLRKLGSFAVDGGEEGTNGLDSGARIVARSLTVTFDWIRGDAPVLPGGILDTGAFAVPIGLLALAGVTFLALRRRSPREVSLCALAGLAVVVQVVSMSRISGPLFTYLVRTTWVVAAFVWMAVIGVLASVIAERVAARGALSSAVDRNRSDAVSDVLATLVGLVVLVTMARGIDVAPLGPYSSWERTEAAITPVVLDAIERAPKPVLLVNGDLTDGAVGSDILAKARAAGLDASKPTDAAFIVGAHRTIDPTTAATTIAIVSNDAIARYAADPAWRLLVRYDALSPQERAELEALESAPSAGLDTTGLTPEQVREERATALDRWRRQQAEASTPSPEFERFKWLADNGDIVAAFERAGPP